MEKKEQMKKYADEAVNIIKDTIINNELINEEFVSYIGCNECGDTVTIRDILNGEANYSLSEVSYVFMDYLDCIGDMNKNVYRTVLDSKDSENYESNKDSFMKSLLKLKQIEQSV